VSGADSKPPTEQDYVRARALLSPLSGGQWDCCVCGLTDVDLGHALWHAQNGDTAVTRRTER